MAVVSGHDGITRAAGARLHQRGDRSFADPETAAVREGRRDPRRGVAGEPDLNLRGKRIADDLAALTRQACPLSVLTETATGFGARLGFEVYERSVESSGRDIPESLDDLCHPSRLALVVYDMQVGVLSQLPDADVIVAKVLEVIEAARQGGYPIFFLRHMFLPNRLKGTFALRMAMAWQQVDAPSRLEEFLLRDSPEFALIPELSPRADEAILDKITMSAFEGTPLAAALRDLGVGAFAIVGVALEIGIEPTVRHATDLGLIPVVVSDACGGRDRPAMDRALAGFAFEGSSLLTDVATIVGRLREVGLDS